MVLKLTGCSRRCSVRPLHADGNDLFRDICRKVSDNETKYVLFVVFFSNNST